MSCRKSQDWREGNGLGRSLAAAMDPVEGRLAVCFGRSGARGGERRMKRASEVRASPQAYSPRSHTHTVLGRAAGGRRILRREEPYLAPLPIRALVGNIPRRARSHTLRSGGKALRPLVFSGVWSHIPFPADDVHGTLFVVGDQLASRGVRSGFLPLHQIRIVSGGAKKARRPSVREKV